MQKEKWEIELELLRSYMNLFINLNSAILFKNHRSAWFPDRVVACTINRSQIPTWEEFLDACQDGRYDWRSKKSYFGIKI